MVAISKAFTTILTSRVFVIGVVFVLGMLIIGSIISQPLTLWGSELGVHEIGFEVIHDTFFSGDKHLSTISGHIELNQIEIATGWKPDFSTAKSEAISLDIAYVTVDWETLGWLTTSMVSMEYWYEWYIGSTLLADAYYGNGQPIVNPGPRHTMTERTESFGDTVFSLALEPDIYLGGQPSGILTCVLKADISSMVADPVWTGMIGPVPIPDFEEWEDTILAYYNAELKAGYAEVRCGGALPDVIAEGEDLQFLLTTGFSHGNPWTVYINNPRVEGKLEFTGDGFTGQDNFGPKIVSWTVPLGWFVPGGMDQEVRVELYSHLWLTSITTFFVIDDPALAPNGPPGGVIESVGGSGDTGTSMTIRLKGIPNELTKEPIAGFWLYVYYGVPGTMPGDQTGLFIINKEWITADAGGNGIKIFQIPENQAGQISMKANAVDVAGRTSLGDFGSFSAFDPTPPYPIPIPPPPPPPPDPTYPFIWTSLMIGLVVIGTILALIIVVYIYIYMKAMLIPWGLIIVIVVWLLFTVPAIIIGYFYPGIG